MNNPSTVELLKGQGSPSHQVSGSTSHLVHEFAVLLGKPGDKAAEHLVPLLPILLPPALAVEVILQLLACADSHTCVPHRAERVVFIQLRELRRIVPRHQGLNQFGEREQGAPEPVLRDLSVAQRSPISEEAPYLTVPNRSRNLSKHKDCLRHVGTDGVNDLHCGIHSNLTSLSCLFGRVILFYHIFRRIDDQH